MAKLKVTIECEYETQDEWYPEEIQGNAEAMAKCDQENFSEDSGALMDVLYGEDYSVKVVVVG